MLTLFALLTSHPEAGAPAKTVAVRQTSNTIAIHAGNGQFKGLGLMVFACPGNKMKAYHLSSGRLQNGMTLVWPAQGHIELVWLGEDSLRMNLKNSSTSEVAPNALHMVCEPAKLKLTVGAEIHIENVLPH